MTDIMKQALRFKTAKSKTMKSRRGHYCKMSDGGSGSVEQKRKARTLRMSHSVDDENYHSEGKISPSMSEQAFIDLLSKAQCRRYESQRSPYSSPIVIPRDKPGNIEDLDGDDSQSDATTPTNTHDISIMNQLDVSVHSSSSSGDDNSHSPIHRILTPGSPNSPSLKPNRRSVEALKKLLELNKDESPFPLIMNPPDGGYWVQNGEYETSHGSDGIWRAPEIDIEHFRLDFDSTALMYGKHFVGKDHKNFYANDLTRGPILFSLMIDNDLDCEPLIRMILRVESETYYKVYPSAQLSRKLEPGEYLSIMASSVLGEDEPLKLEYVSKITSPKAQELLQKFDEHSIAKEHKIGIIYQKYGQATEEEMFCNSEHSRAFKEFLELLGDTVELNGFEGYRGGLDCKNGQTGKHSIYTQYKGQEIMFHVSTLLPHDPSDRQQVAKKRHIGNDIVLIVFQDQNTPYSPDCVRSRFLHAHIVVQVEQPCTDNTVYKVAVAAKEEVPDFSPPLPTPAVFAKDEDFREWLLTKILNAETQCHKAPDFLRLATRTRTQLFHHLFKELGGVSDYIDTPTHEKDKRRSLSQLADSADVGSPRRRRKTFGNLFPRRRISANSNSPPKVRTRILSDDSNIMPSSNATSITASTPDLTSIGEESTEAVFNDQLSDRQRALTMEAKGNRKISETTVKSAVKKKLLKRNKKSKQSNSRDDMSKTIDPRYIGFGSNNRGSLATSLNWSVPSNLPGIVSEAATNSSNPTSLENISFNLEMQSSLESMRCSSNPDMLAEQLPLQQDHYTVRRPGSAGPDTFDVGVQVEVRRPIFMYPTPPNSVSPTLPPDSVLVSHAHTHATNSSVHSHMTKHSSPNRHYRTIAAHDLHDVTNYHSSSSSSFDNRYSGASFPFVPEEEDSEQQKPHKTKDRNSFRMPVTTSAPNVTQLEEGDQSSDSMDDTGSDNTYDSMLNSLQSLTREVNRLREQQIHLYKENTKLAAKARKWKTKYHNMKQQMEAREETITDLREQLSPNTEKRRPSEVGTVL